MKSLNDDKPLGAVALNSFQRQLDSDTRIAATMDNAMNGEIAPTAHPSVHCLVQHGRSNRQRS